MNPNLTHLKERSQHSNRVHRALLDTPPDVCNEYDRRDVEEILRGAKEVLEWVKIRLNL